MACCNSVSFFNGVSSPSQPSKSSVSSLKLPSTSQSTAVSKTSYIQSNRNLLFCHYRSAQTPTLRASNFPVTASVAAKERQPLKIMISGAPASGKGTQCELIKRKYDLVHIAAGDLLRAEIAAGTDNGKRAKEYMEKGQLVPDEIVVTMVKDRLLCPDSLDKGWLLDGYPRSSSQANALKALGFQPDLFILLEVPEGLLVERVVGRRLDPVTGKIYHLKYSPPETEEIAARLTQRFDDTEEKVKLRLRTHNQNVESVLSMYEDITVKVDGSVSKDAVFAQIDGALAKLLEIKGMTLGSVAA
ncbi:hypothetical protein M9H77_17988 [Catharanthus roseus]|uniref:Uncharacterized protein n=1 Tax=Catharanthus roseus TaxID=4058 RepID=A0ACC0B653_CATRO|nr:hypothetical protein M9H77_17988 [Catharanthus roseus]